MTQNNEKIAYFDNAATTFPKPKSVYDFMDTFYRTFGANANRGQYKLSSVTSKLIFNTRENIKKLLDCQNKDVIFTPNATLALNMIIQGILKNPIIDKNNESHLDEHSAQIKNVYISPFEHNAVTRILENYKIQNKIAVHVLPISPNYEYDFSKIDETFSKTPPELLILTHASNVCGLICPIEKICELAKKYNATTVLDMAQTAALVPLNLANENFDFAVFEGHKTLFGPTGAAGFVKSKSAQLEPFLFGGTGVESANQSMPEELPYKYEMGTLNIHAIAGLYEATIFLLENRDKIRVKEEENHQKLLSLLRKYNFIKIEGPQNRTNCIGVVSVNFTGYTSDEIANVLDSKNIAVRSGLQCAPLAHKTLGTFPAGTVRFSVSYFTCDEDFLMLKEALDYIKENI